jgi:hypothetical protein
MSRTVLTALALSLLTACGAEATPEPAPAPAPVEAAPAPAPVEAAPVAAAPPAAPAGAKVIFVSPKDGDKVKSPVKIVMGVEGVEVKPAGELAPNTGHHHVIIDAAGVTAGETVPKDEKHVHFGKGQTEAELELTPGEHTLTLQFADGNHTSYGDVLATTIKITVE